MPIFEYVCRECDRQFEAIVTPSRPAACPSCQSADLDKQHSVFAVGASSSPMRSAPSPSMGACGTCGDPRGPGACSLN